MSVKDGCIAIPFDKCERWIFCEKVINNAMTEGKKLSFEKPYLSEICKNVYKRTITIKFYINNVNLDVISLTEIDFGTYTYSIMIESK